jgi:lysylphosphatidylglycerol synthetase-like protein (DUF2156 family)
LLAMALAPAHRLFYRRASLFSTTFSIGWIVAIAAVLGCAIWLVLFSYKHVDYSGDLWWEFSFHQGGAPRALRALVAAAAAGMLFALASLIRPVQLHREPPSEAELAQALPLIKQFPSAQAHLALMGDKTLLFDPEHKAFVMYDIEGRSWVTMGDPVGTDDDARRELVWTFHVREKRFSLGAFDPRYLVRMPMAVVWQSDQPVAFANMFLNETKQEASLDLMRHLPDGPAGIMDFLFVELMQWAQGEGYQWFNLGMAPLAGLHNRRQAPLWNRFGALVFGRGERFYNFRGLQRYKEKFDPQWEPRYMAVPGGIALPMILANVASLISGGLSGVVRR